MRTDDVLAEHGSTQFCKLQAKDFYTQMSRMKPWGWRHMFQFPKLCALSLSG